MDRGIHVEVQVPLPVTYKGTKLAEIGHGSDTLVAGEIILELKSVDAIAPGHRAQFHRICGRRTCALVYKVERLKEGGIAVDRWLGKEG